MQVQQKSSLLTRLSSIACSAVLGVSSIGCAAQSRYSTEALHAMAPNAGIVDVCMHFPMSDPDATVVAFDSKSRIAVSDANWEKFKVFAAKNADRIYRFDPNMPDETAWMLPEPYNIMSCRTLAATNTPPLPKGMKEIPITPAMREALVTALIEVPSEPLRPAPQENVFLPLRPDPRYLAQGLFLGPAADGRTPQQRIEAVGQMLRDALRFAAPKIQGPNDEQVSIIDTKTGQVVGGFAAGGTIGTLPGGAFVSEKLQTDPNLPKPTREFLVAEGAGELLSGGVQIILGTGGSIGGGAATLTGGGAVLGVPMCAAGVTLAANGSITFLHGLKTITVAICDWQKLPSIDDAQPLAAVALKDPAGPPASPPASPAPAPSPVKPAPVPVQAAKPSPPVKPLPAAKPTDPIVVTVRPSGTTTTTRPRLKEGQKPSDTTIMIRTDEAGNVISKTTTKTTATASSATQAHHPWPKYLGGPAKQDLAKLPDSVHKSYHSGLDKILPRQRGTAYYDNLNPQAKQQLIRDLAAYTKAFDAKYGTQLYGSMIRNGFPGSP